ncbi:oxidoreductase [Mycobacterium antarcticum]|uniref:SDR family oxidoreductase n=1 Tax=Mycolicibacterium sp. TUM20983 TaxID=3023369 RepID=UPI0023A04AFB|nr:SDR family NAD(P)-dependent oxidoreductase [Mycolicibacterium sp. TUM20983]GLP75971.1 oxidoreductase [Mycolicibacterium sp. TUM20983]
MAQRVVDGVVLVTGASSGIGAGIAARFHARGAQVIISGRDRARLESVAGRHPGMSMVVMDVADPESVARGLADVAAETPHLSTLVNNAGIQRRLDFTAAEPPGPADIASEIATNFTGLINVTAAALPLLRRAPRSRVVHVGSGLGFVPYASAPVYSATKAAVHSFTVSLRRQLAGSTVQVVEIIPPVVDTPLHRDMPSTPPMAMSLEGFLDRAMRGLDAGRDEIPIGLGRVSQIGARVAPKLLLALINRGG